jgi:hypothetical protein
MDDNTQNPSASDLLDDSDIVLTSSQELQVMQLWNANPAKPPTIKELTQALFGAGFDGRSLQAKAIKTFLASRNLRAKSTEDPIRDIELSEAHKIYIQNNLKTMGAWEMAKIIFANPKLSAIHGETRAVSAYIKSLLPAVTFTPGRNDEVPTKAYVPPKTLQEAVERVGQYVNFGFDKDKLNAHQKKNLHTLIGYMHTYRFIAQMNNYVTESDRHLAEDAFVRATFDKPDLAQEEIDQYIEYANQVVTGFTVQRRSNQLQASLEEITTANDDSLKISMSLVEAIGKASTEYHQCLARQQKLLDDLKEKRSARLGKQIKDNASILNLVEIWRSEEGRAEMFQHADKEQGQIKEEIEKISQLPDIKARILGLVKDEIRYG